MSEILRVLSAGLQSTVQDLGRYGYAHMGVSASGPADRVSARVANRLVGNNDNCPILEMTLLGGQFEFGCDATVALAGANFKATLNDNMVPLFEAVHIWAGSVLRCGSAATGSRCYLAVAGGFAISAVLGSSSTHLMSGIGGLSGRALKKGDILPLKPMAAAELVKIDPLLITPMLNRKKLRVTLGPQHEFFGEHGIKSLCSQSFIVAKDFNRVGVRLEGAVIKPVHGSTMLTEGTSLGAIQVPRGGSPIILFVEHQTTGGYPKIANVISADLPSVGQLRPQDEIQFELVSMHNALELLKAQEELLDKALRPA